MTLVVEAKGDELGTRWIAIGIKIKQPGNTVVVNIERLLQ